MGGGIGRLCLMVIALVAVTSAPDVAEAAMSCGQVLSSVSACLPYLQGGGNVSPPCCDGLKFITKAATATTADLQALCSCTKSLQPRVGAKTQYINGLPVKCSVKFPYIYSPSMDCSKVK